MEGLTELIPFLVEEGNPQMWNDFLKTCKELKIFVKKANELVPSINSLLNEPQTRIFGLRILEVFLTQCPKSVVSGHIVHWFHQCVKGLTQSKSEQVILSFNVLRTLLETSVEFPEVRKQTSQVFIPKLLDTIVDKLKVQPENCIPVLQCLYACLFYYGKSCGSSRVNLEKILINLILSERNAIIHVSKCFHLLAQTGAPGAELINYKQNWNSQHLIVLNSLHFVLDQLFSDVSEILGSFNQCTVEKRKLDLPVVNDEFPFIKSHKLSILFCGLCQLTQNMLLDTFPTSKKIYPEVIFGVVCRALAVTCKSLESKISNSTYAVMSQICDVHISAIKLLDSLILCSRTLLLPFSAIVSKLFTQIFKSTDVESWVEGRERPFSRVREASYRCLLTWLSLGKSCSFAETHVNVIVEAITKDVKCEKKVVSLNLEQKTRSKGAKKTAVAESSDIMEMNALTCQAALACVPPLLRTPLSLANVKRLQEVVVKLIFEIQRVLRYDEGLPPPYSNSQCRAQLYSALSALCISPHPHFPPPLHYANVLFNAASSDCDVQVQKVCSNAVNSMAHMLRPCAPSFDFYCELDSDIIPINPYPEPTDKELKGLSNRSMLEVASESNSNSDSLLEEIMTSKYRAVMNDAIDQVTSNREAISKADSSKSKVLKVNPKSGDSDELIDLDDSSDESLILVDSKEKSFSERGKFKAARGKTLYEENDNTTEVVTVEDSHLASSSKTRSSKQEKDLKIDVMEKHKSIDMKLEDESCSSWNTNQIYNKNMRSSQTRSNGSSDSDDVVEISKEDYSNDLRISNIQVNLSALGMYKKAFPKLDNTTLSDNSITPPPACTSSGKGTLDPSGQSTSKMQTRSSKAAITLVTADVNKATKGKASRKISDSDECETQSSEDVSIIETPETPSFRSKRLCKSKPSDKTSSDIENPSIVGDEEPVIKKLRSNKSLVYGKLSDKRSVENGKHKENTDESPDDICEIDDDDDDDEMMSSFIDSVPD